ncbi:Myotubularin-related 2 [Gossypium arboreum]|uniref:phosphatidylinositol-3,5-bisphosphate 3-phosphatase n=1 Tax=Gossypium arboreum TaxID=29729 RepID=A0A0B0NYY4_GOSAR|nr:Myotubularin-related 2 [Gossypium arboreum]
MAALRPPRSVSSRDSSDGSERLDGAGSWDALEWTKIEPVTRSVSHVNSEFLLEAERVIEEGHGVVLVNRDEAGTLFVTNFRLLFLSDGTRNIVPLGTIPLATIEKFNKMRRVIFDALLRCAKPARIWDLYAFTCGPSKFSKPNSKVRLLNEYFRLLGKDSHCASVTMPMKSWSLRFALNLLMERVQGESYILLMQDQEKMHWQMEQWEGARSLLQTIFILRHGGSTWGGGNLSSMSASVSTLGDSGWLIHVQSVLAGSAWITARIALESASVLVHCSDGWDRTSQLVSLANLMLDPYYRTFAGFQALVEKDWLAFGHPFSDRIGMPSVSGTSFDLNRQSSTGNLSSSPVRQSSGSFTPQTSNTSHAQNNYSPIFLQWVDCVSQLLRMYPFAFEFSSTFLVDFLDCVLSCRFGNFLCNSEKEREKCGIHEACGCLWAYFADLRSLEGSSHAHYNLFYDPLKHNGPIFPPAAALAPTLWPQFHLRWACPSESQAGELEAESRSMAIKFSELLKAKEAAEMKAKEYSAAMETLEAELRNEKRLSSSAMNLAQRASKESAAIKRAILSLGCRVNYTSNGDCTVDVESNPTGSQEKSIQSPPRKESDGTKERDDNSDLSVSVTVVSDDVSSSPLGQVCETLCPLRTRDGSCQWPSAGCAQLGSQFVGLKANFDAFDHLSIYDSYFESN